MQGSLVKVLATGINIVEKIELELQCIGNFVRVMMHLNVDEL